ncbi:MAG: RNA polymerase subunit sigma [Bacteroidetes bacterium]|nr:MAG: RNA polymerase subunit sigma [Bacteroidota bacterium]
MKEDYSDEELLKQFENEGTRPKAFNLLVIKYQKRLYWHIRKMVLNHDDADDILQNVWIKIWNGLSKFRSDAGLYTWMYRIASNECLTFLNKKKKKLLVPLADMENLLSQSLEADSYFSGDEIQLKLQKAVLSLPEKQRIVFNLRYYDEMKYEEMSGLLLTSVGALKASYHHAAKKIEKFISGD